MKLIGLPLNIPNLYGMLAFITAPFFNKPKSIAFLVDTGASYTTIGYSDALDYKIVMMVKDGKPQKIITAAGEIESIPLYDCTLHLITDDSQMYQETLKVIYVLKYNPTMGNQDTIMRIPSVLGMDFLKYYKIYFSDHRVVLEK